ncbi:hypothetical protein EJB05_53628 [Eragrostis curvula]|uniref:S-locus receptor kinase C-terminal domain-containing protein n=1 Tax=Eragrostis curvula TaxID=38414 RepID=A0A5J9SPM9_9POAL|nr:hypothetical protein EJB05_53628 [Eragrostis curvula]
MEEGLGERMAGSPFRLRHRRLMDTGASAPASTPGHSGSNNGVTIMVTILVVVIVCSLCYCVYCWRWRKRNAVRRAQIERLRPLSNSDLPLMDLSSIYAATNSFCKENKLGEGGFGPVYRGVLGGGAEIAAWKLWNEDKAAEFMDASLAGSYSREEAWRCFHVGLLCVQENPELRPTMSNVVLMLISGDQTQMPVPAAPPLFTRLKTPVSVSEFSLAMRTDTTKTQSVNEVSISMIEPR